MKHGIRRNKSGNIQRYSCNSCGKWFTFNIGFERMHATPQIITSAMQLYFSGESFRNSKRFLELQGVKISHVAVYNTAVVKRYHELRAKLTTNIDFIELKRRVEQLHACIHGGNCWAGSNHVIYVYQTL